MLPKLRHTPAMHTTSETTSHDQILAERARYVSAGVSTFEVEPAPAPTIVSVERRLVTEGEDVAVRFHAAGGAAAMAFVAADGGEANAEVPVGDGVTSGDATASTAGWGTGAYEAVLRSASGADLASAAFWVQARDGGPEIETAKPIYAAGEAIEVAWRFTPGNRADWVGVYRRDADPNRASYLLWVYTGGTVEGSATFDRDTVGAWPLRPGEYSVYLLRDDSYVRIGAGAFTVR